MGCTDLSVVVDPQEVPKDLSLLQMARQPAAALSPCSTPPGPLLGSHRTVGLGAASTEQYSHSNCQVCAAAGLMAPWRPAGPRLSSHLLGSARALLAIVTCVGTLAG